MPEAESRGAATGVELAGFCLGLSDCAIAIIGMHANTEIKIFLFICFSFSKPILGEHSSVWHWRGLCRRVSAHREMFEGCETRDKLPRCLDPVWVRISAAGTGACFAGYPKRSRAREHHRAADDQQASAPVMPCHLFMKKNCGQRDRNQIGRASCRERV